MCPVPHGISCVDVGRSSVHTVARPHSGGPEKAPLTSAVARICREGGTRFADLDLNNLSVDDCRMEEVIAN